MRIIIKEITNKIIMISTIIKNNIITPTKIIKQKDLIRIIRMVITIITKKTIIKITIKINTKEVNKCTIKSINNLIKMDSTNREAIIIIIINSIKIIIRIRIFTLKKMDIIKKNMNSNMLNKMVPKKIMKRKSKKIK